MAAWMVKLFLKMLIAFWAPELCIQSQFYQGKINNHDQMAKQK